MDMRWERAAKVREVVVKYLVSHVGERALADSPHFDEERKVWLVPVLCRTSRGTLLAGEIQLNQNLEIVCAPSKEELTRAVEAQLERIPYLVYADKEELEAKGFKPITLWEATVPLSEEEQSTDPTPTGVLRERRGEYRTAKLAGETTETEEKSIKLLEEENESK
jgi:hypothetical protein